ncbi:hypothetical protein SynBIOSU31_01922 [Synechococcus sp. BIOS-U3-1]|nr:hypothetical protein SynBIOSU31_01922 [Synechococcus sp. BIOS-U3-1]
MLRLRIITGPQSRQIAQQNRSNSEINLLNPLQADNPEWQQQPEGPALTLRLGDIYLHTFLAQSTTF